jgi:hypothetical protein
MTPGEASEQGAVMIIDHPEGGQRVAAHVFDTQNGIAWVDSGWTANDTGHTVHETPGTFAEFELGWGATRDDGEDVFIERHPDEPAQEGDREQARQAIIEELQARII